MVSGPLALTFDAVTHPDPRDRIAAWRDAFSLTVDAHFDAGEIDDFVASVLYHPLGSILLVDRRYTNHTVVRSRATIARTGSEHLIFHYFLEGGIDGRVGERSLDAAAGDCFLYDMRGTLRIRMLAGRFIGLIMPRRLFEEAAGPSAGLHGMVLRAGSAPAEFVGAMLVGLANHVGRFEASSMQALGAAVIGLVAAAIDTQSVASPSRPSAKSPPRGETTKKTASLTRLRRHIDRNAADPAFNPEALSSAFGLSRATLYRMFQQEGGVAEVIRRRRATLALASLNENGSKPASLALAARAGGFPNTAALRRALRAVYGATPATLRRQAIRPDVEPGPGSLAIGALFDGLPS